MLSSLLIGSALPRIEVEYHKKCSLRGQPRREAKRLPQISQKGRHKMYCSKCGHKNEDSARFCAGCGQAIAEESTASPWRSARDIPRKERRTLSDTPAQPVYSPPADTGGYNAPIVVKHTRKSSTSIWLVPVIIISALAIVAAILFSTAKKCENCGKLFWGESHYFFGYVVCDDCWN